MDSLAVLGRSLCMYPAQGGWQPTSEKVNGARDCSSAVWDARQWLSNSPVIAGIVCFVWRGRGFRDRSLEDWVDTSIEKAEVAITWTTCIENNTF